MTTTRAKVDRDILDFARRRLKKDRAEFSLPELTEYIIGRHPAVTPDSVGRMLRALRQRGCLSYELVCRNKSRYRLLSAGRFRRKKQDKPNGKGSTLTLDEYLKTKGTSRALDSYKQRALSSEQLTIILANALKMVFDGDSPSKVYLALKREHPTWLEEVEQIRRRHS